MDYRIDRFDLSLFEHGASHGDLLESLSQKESETIRESPSSI